MYENLKARDEKRLATATKEANSSQKANNKKVKDATALLARHFNGYLQDFSAEIEAIKLGMSINQDSLARRTQPVNEYVRSERDAGNARSIAEQKRQAIRFAAAIGVKIEIATFDESFEKTHNLQENHADYSPNAQGLYTDGVLYINERYIDPTSQSAMFVTIKHELSHFIETNSSAYQAMLRFTKGYLRSQGMDFSVIAAQKTADYLQEGIALTPAQVESEVVAMVNSEILLNDPQAVAAFVSDAPNVAQRFWTRLKDIISNYGKVRPDKQLLAGNAMFKAAFQNAKAVVTHTDTPRTINDTEQVDTEQSDVYNDIRQEYRAIVAPYHNTQVTNSNFSDVRSKVSVPFKEAAEKIAKSLGVEIVGTEDNVGSYTFEKTGEKVREISSTFIIKAESQEAADVFASMLGDMGHETQESVISGRYLAENEQDKATCIELEIPVKNLDGDIETLHDLIKSAGFDAATLDTTNNVVRILNFDTNVTPEQIKEQFENIFNGIGDYYDDTRSNQARRQQSSLYTASDRRSLYQAWENSRSDLRQSGAVFGDGSLLAEAKARNEQFQREQERAKLKKQATAADV